MNSERLEDLIQSLKTDNCKHPTSTLKHLRVVLKAFGSYSTTADTLPPPTLIPVCLFSIPTIFFKLLDCTEGDVLTEPPQKTPIRLCLQLFLRGLLRLLGECQEEIKHVVVQSMSKSILLTAAFPTIARKWVRALTHIWATSWENLNLGLRCFVALERILKKSDDQFYMWTVRRVYVGFFQKCGQISWKNIEHISFMSNCFCEFVKINPSRSYYVLFGYLRSLALQLGSLNSLKGKLKADLIVKLYSQQTLQILKLLAQVVGRVGDEQISALAYPLVEVINAYEHISESPEYLSLKLHLIQIELQLMEQTGLYFPHTLETIIKILRSTPLQKKISKKAGVEGSIELGYHLSQTELKNTNIVNDIFQKTVYCLYWLHSLVSKTLSAPEIINYISKMILSLEFGFLGYKKQLKEAVILFKADAEKIQAMRSKRKMSLGDTASEKFGRFLATKVELEGRNKYEELQKEHQNMIRAKILAEHQDDNDDDQNQDQQEEQVDDELENGWQEASEGASEFEEQQQQKPINKKKKQDENESVSYEGDPEDAEEAVKEWSEHEWSSQEEVQHQ